MIKFKIKIKSIPKLNCSTNIDNTPSIIIIEEKEGIYTLIFWKDSYEKE